MTTSHARQQWLDQCAVELKGHFLACQPATAYPDKIRVSWGFPSKRATGKIKAIGIYYAPAFTADAHAEIFIHPIHATKPTPEMDIAATMAHELAHAILGHEVGHKAPFKRLVTAIGLTGKPTSTSAGPDFIAAMTAKLAALGPFPTSGLDPANGPGKKQSTRLKKCSCPQCGYVCRVTAKHLDALGAPICPCNHEPMTIDGQPADGDEPEGDN